MDIFGLLQPRGLGLASMETETLTVNYGVDGEEHAFTRAIKHAKWRFSSGMRVWGVGRWQNPNPKP